jgi:hypothetical protein
MRDDSQQGSRKWNNRYLRRYLRLFGMAQVLAKTKFQPAVSLPDLHYGSFYNTVD